MRGDVDHMFTGDSPWQGAVRADEGQQRERNISLEDKQTFVKQQFIAKQGKKTNIHLVHFFIRKVIEEDTPSNGEEKTNLESIIPKYLLLPTGTIQNLD